MDDDKWYSAKEIADILKIHHATVSALANKFNLSIHKKDKKHWLFKLPEIQEAILRGQPNQYNAKFLNPPNTKIYDDYWTLPWDEFIIACDTHSPHLNEKIFNLMLKVAIKYKIPNFLHPGDFFDGNTFSRFDVEPEDMVPLEYEIEYSRKIIQSLKSTFKNVYFSMGSHDVRFWLFMLRQGKTIPYDQAFRLVGEDGINISKYRYARIGEEWHITHPKNVVKVGGLPSVRLCAKFNRSVVFGHGHWWGINKDPSAKHWLIAPGCLVDPKRIGYKALWDTSHDEWYGGFLMVVDKNKPILFGEDSPWGIYLK